MKITEPQLHHNDDDYADVVTYILVGNTDWKFVMSLEKETGNISDGDVQCAEHPNGAFEEAEHAPPGVAVRAYDGLRQRARNLLESQAPVLNVSIQAGLATMVCGTQVDLLKIQAAVNFAYQELGEPELSEAVDELSKLTGKWQGPHGQWLRNTEAAPA